MSYYQDLSPPPIEECTICKELFDTDLIYTPCCLKPFCAQCLRTWVTVRRHQTEHYARPPSENGECPNCRHTLAPLDCVLFPRPRTRWQLLCDSFVCCLRYFFE